jgi:cytochrome oxidase Cu insertion factor (SCO1/SenC/PrrC family)
MNAPIDTTRPAGHPLKSRKQVYILIGVFFAPLILAFILYYGLGVRPSGSTNKGDLIHPAVPLPEVTLPSGSTSGGDQKLPANILRGKWTMVFIGDGACDNRCREALTLMRQTRLALNDDMTRVQRLFLITGNCCDSNYLEQQQRGLLLGRIDNPEGKTLLETFPDGAQAGQPGRIYLVDPLGNLMMKYEPNAPQKGLLEDMKKLLKLSHIG